MVFVNLRKIVEMYENNMLVLVDEAHGTHFYFGDDMPISAMEANADMAVLACIKLAVL